MVLSSERDRCAGVWLWHDLSDPGGGISQEGVSGFLNSDSVRRIDIQRIKCRQVEAPVFRTWRLLHG
jgi:hypothetical protein